MDFEVIDDLVTDDPYAALSARQGKILNEKTGDPITNAEIDTIFI